MCRAALTFCGLLCLFYSAVPLPLSTEVTGFCVHSVLCGASDVAQVVECLTSMHNTQGLNPSTTRTRSGGQDQKFKSNLDSMRPHLTKQCYLENML